MIPQYIVHRSGNVYFLDKDNQAYVRAVSYTEWRLSKAAIPIGMPAGGRYSVDAAVQMDIVVPVNKLPYLGTRLGKFGMGKRYQHKMAGGCYRSSYWIQRRNQF